MSEKAFSMLAASTMKVRFPWVQFVITVSCLTVFILMARQQYDYFEEEPTGTSLSGGSISGYSFPAVTICDSHFENARAYDELGFPVSPFGRPREVTSNPLRLYEKLTDFKFPIMTNLWKFYLTLDKKILERSKKAETSFIQITDNNCRVGKIECGIRLGEHGDKVVPNGESEMTEVHVPAGKWISRFLADSTDGTNQLCHTLIPNVTVTFDNPLGHSIALKWENTYITKSNFWKVYVHDIHEHVLLDSYAIKTMPSVTFLKYDLTDETKTKKKLLMLPRLTKHPSSSEVLPCVNCQDYSENWCNIQWGWKENLQEMKNYYGKRFTCRIPGIWTDKRSEMPICSHYDPSTGNGSLGFLNLMGIPTLGRHEM